jgi:hypothetical protein
MEYAAEEFLGRESPGPLEAVQDFLSSLLEVITSALARSADRRNCSVAKMAQGRKASQDGSRVNHSAEIIPFRKAFFLVSEASGPLVYPRRSPFHVAVRAAVEAYEASGHMLDAALAYAEHGYPISPVTVKDKVPVAPRDKDENGEPIDGTGSFYKASIDRWQIRKWWRRKEHLIAIEGGPVSGVWVADIDTSEDHASAGVDGWEKLRAEHPPFETREHRSATGGPHVIFKWDDAHPIGNSSGALPDGIQVKSKGGYFVLPPSRRKGRAYEVFVDVDPIDAPEWLLELLVNSNEPHTPNEQLVADDIAKLAYAVSIIPNNYKGRQEWKEEFAMPLWAATNGSDEGFAIFEEFNQRWSKRKRTIGDTAHKVWYDELSKRPPSKAGAGKIFWMADQAHPGWRDNYTEQVWEDIRAAFEARRKSRANGDAAPDADDAAEEEAGEKPKLMQSSKEFVAGFVPPDYLIDGLLQRRYVYSLTGPTGDGKTAVGMRVAAHVAEGLRLAGKQVEKGRVLFFAGENPDDVRSRWIMLCEAMYLDHDAVDVVFMPFRVDLSEEKIRKQIDSEAAENGPFSLLIVDTSASFYSGDDENDNVKLGKHARMLRTFVDLPGGPTVLVTCHPTKTPNMDNLLPGGGGAFLAEVDGNLVAIKDKAKMLVEISTHGKFRGPEFAPFPFKLVPATSNRLVDSKGRSIWSIYAEPISQAQQEEMESWGMRNQDDLLRALLTNAGGSMSELAELLNWKTISGDPHKVRVHRVMMDLLKNKLVEKRRDGHYVLTKTGRTEAEAVGPDVEVEAPVSKATKPTRAETRKQEEERRAASAKYEKEAKAAWLKTPAGRASRK